MHWEIDPAKQGWLQADLDGEAIFLRFNFAYPATALYSLLIDTDEVVDLEDLSPQWTRTSDFEWPDTASPADDQYDEWDLPPGNDHSAGPYR